MPSSTPAWATSPARSRPCPSRRPRLIRRGARHVATAKDNTYPISRFLYYYTNGDPTGVAKEFIDYALSADGQKIVETWVSSP